MNINQLNTEQKKKILNALQKGYLTKEALKKANAKEIIVLLTKKFALMCIRMGEIETCSFDGNTINKEEYERLYTLSESLGNDMKWHTENWSFEVI